MSHLEQDVFVATSWDRDQNLALEKACQDLGLPVRVLADGYWTVVVPTSGSEQALQLLVDAVRGLGAVDWFLASYGVFVRLRTESPGPTTRYGWTS